MTTKFIFTKISSVQTFLNIIFKNYHLKKDFPEISDCWTYEISKYGCLNLNTRLPTLCISQNWPKKHYIFLVINKVFFPYEIKINEKYKFKRSF